MQPLMVYTFTTSVPRHKSPYTSSIELCLHLLKRYNWTWCTLRAKLPTAVDQLWRPCLVQDNDYCASTKKGILNEYTSNTTDLTSSLPTLIILVWIARPVIPNHAWKLHMMPQGTIQTLLILPLLIACFSLKLLEMRYVPEDSRYTRYTV